MNNKIKTTSLIVLLLFVTVSASNAQNRRANSRMSFRGQCMNIPELSDDQKDQISAINEAHRTTLDELREQLWNSEDRIAANEIRSKMILEQNKHLKKVSEVLDKEQLEYYNANVISNVKRGDRSYARGRRGSAQFEQGNRPGRGRNAVNRGPRAGRRAYCNW